MNIVPSLRKLLIVAAMCPLAASSLRGNSPETLHPDSKEHTSIPETTVSVMLLAGLAMMISHRRRLSRR